MGGSEWRIVASTNFGDRKFLMVVEPKLLSKRWALPDLSMAEKRSNFFLAKFSLLQRALTTDKLEMAKVRNKMGLSGC